MGSIRNDRAFRVEKEKYEMTFCYVFLRPKVILKRELRFSLVESKLSRYKGEVKCMT